MRRVTRLGAAAAVVAAGAIGGSAAVSAQPDHGHHQQRIQHVLLISVDGMHQSDLNWYVAHHPGSELAKLASGGAEFTNNHTADPSDSDPGGTAIMTGGDPRATGVYYDVEYSHAVDEAGAPCTPGQPATGGDVIYDSPDDKLNAVPDFLGRQRHLPVVRRRRLDLPRAEQRGHEPGGDHEHDADPADRAQPGHLPGRPGRPASRSCRGTT